MALRYFYLRLRRRFRVSRNLRTAYLFLLAVPSIVFEVRQRLPDDPGPAATHYVHVSGALLGRVLFSLLNRQRVHHRESCIHSIGSSTRQVRFGAGGEPQSPT